MFAKQKTTRIAIDSDSVDRVTRCAARMYWLTTVLTESAEDAAALTSQGIELLLTGNHVFDSWLAHWACKIALKMCIAKKHSELAAEQHNASFWNEAADELEFDPVQPLRGLTLESIQQAVRALPVLPRFMFVLHVLERYTLGEAAGMLQLDKSTCDAALAYALALVTETVHSSELSTWIESHGLA